MHLSAARDDLVIAFNECSKLHRESVAGLSAENDLFVVSSRHDDLTYRHEIPCDGNGSPCCVMPLAIGQFLASCSADHATIEVDGDLLRVKCGANKARFPLVDAMYETVAMANTNNAICLDNAMVFDGLYAITKTQGRENLAQVIIENKHAITTDGHRLVLASAPDCKRIAIPAYIANKATECMRDAPVQICSGERSCMLVYRQQQWSQAQVAGQFPDYNTILKGCSCDCTVSCDTHDLLSALGTVLLLSDHGRVLIEANNNQLTIKTENGPNGDGTTTIACNGDAWHCTINGRYLAQAIKGSTSIEICHGGELSMISVKQYVGDNLLKTDHIMLMV